MLRGLVGRQFLFVGISTSPANRHATISGILVRRFWKVSFRRFVNESRMDILKMKQTNKTLVISRGFTTHKIIDFHFS